jgi:hypothetical protein
MAIKEKVGKVKLNREQVTRLVEGKEILINLPPELTSLQIIPTVRPHPHAALLESAPVKGLLDWFSGLMSGNPSKGSGGKRATS